MRMKRMMVVTCAALLAMPAMSVRSAAADKAPATQPANDTIRDLAAKNSLLSEQVQALQLENKSLRRQLEQLRKLNQIGVSKGELPSLPYSGALLSPAPEKAPRGAIAHEFNGDVFYVVPLESQSSHK